VSNIDGQHIFWTEGRQRSLRDFLEGFWAQDEWDLAVCPLARPGQPHLKIRFTCSSPSLNTELKYACWKKFMSREWVLPARSHASRINRLVSWLNALAPATTSLLTKELPAWELSLRSYLTERGLWQPSSTENLDKFQQPHSYLHEDPCLSTLRQLYKTLQEVYDVRVEYEKDIWQLRHLNVRGNQAQSLQTLNFTKLTPLWLRQAAKQFLRYRLAIFSVGDSLKKLEAIKTFSAFLNSADREISPSGLDRALILDYLSYLASSGSAAKTRIAYIADLRTFLELCAREKWLDVPEKRLIYDDDLPRRNKPLPRFIPMEVLDQLNQHVDALPAQIRRMVLIIQECGMRISELCTLPFDCLVQDASGDWFLRYYQGKMHKEHSIPIAREVAQVIQEQQQATRSECRQQGHSALFLFSNAKGEPLKRQVFIRALNQLAYQKGIRDRTGQLYHFQTHQFRHTVGTRMINNGVPQHIIQQFLGHESPEMTSVYAHLHDQTLKEEYAKFRGRIVDVTGRVVEQDGTANSSDLQWVKKNILAQALPNGKCALPVVAGECPHANACLTCVHFRTDSSFLPQHKSQLQETQHLIQVASSNGWKRQVEMNERVVVNLQSIITALEETSHDA
jgi:integrase